jgi:hypothetical protein
MLPLLVPFSYFLRFKEFQRRYSSYGRPIGAIYREIRIAQFITGTMALRYPV